LSLDKNCFNMAWLLLMKSKPFSLHGRPDRMKYLRFLPGYIIKTIRVLLIMKRLLFLKFLSRTSEEIINVSMDGHILLRTTMGFKVFNLEKLIVASQYHKLDRKLYNKIANGIDKLVNLDLAPTIKKVDYENKRIYEEYINEYQANRFYPMGTYFYSRILPIWKEIINQYPSRFTEITPYVKDQGSFVLNKIRQFERRGLNKNYTEPIKHFTKYLTNRI